MLKSISLLLAVASVGFASPIAQRNTLCANDLASATTGGACSVTWAGTALTGASDGGACRYTVRYGSANRWEDSVAGTQTGVDAAAFPNYCPQATGYEFPSFVSSSLSASEDCLFATVYAPASATSDSALPVLVWVHGGALIAGASTMSGLNASALATEGNMIVVLLQYRLGPLGFLPPSVSPFASDPSFGLRDIILALNVVKDNIAAVGGSASSVTLGGQSSGGTLVRMLYGAPTAKGLFHRVILQSDPFNVGAQSSTVQAGVESIIYSGLGCTTLDCYKGLSVDSLMSVTAQAQNTAAGSVTGLSVGSTFLPMFGSNTLPNDPTYLLFNSPSSLPISPADVPLLLTEVKNEAGTAIGNNLPQMSTSALGYSLYLLSFLGQSRAAAVTSSSYYAWDASNTGTDYFREQMELVLTDGGWRCANREAARKYAAAGGSVYFAEWTEGATYANQPDFCTGKVCHSDDIYPTFNTISSPSSAQSTLESTIASDWVAFIKSGAPSSSWAKWTSASTDADVHNLGSGATLNCPANFWGTTAKWDFQLYSAPSVSSAASSSSSSSAVVSSTVATSTVASSTKASSTTKAASTTAKSSSTAAQTTSTRCSGHRC